MISYAGSFVVIEEASEKTEKTEKSEEAIHSIYHSKAFGKTLIKNNESKKCSELELLAKGCYTTNTHHLPQDFNINFIYYTSFLEFSC